MSPNTWTDVLSRLFNWWLNRQGIPPAGPAWDEYLEALLMEAAR